MERRVRRWAIFGQRPSQTWLLVAGAVPFALIIAAPIAAIFLRVLPTGALQHALASPVVIESLRLSALTTITSLALALVLGTPLAYLLARTRFPGHSVLESLI